MQNMNYTYRLKIDRVKYYLKTQNPKTIFLEDVVLDTTMLAPLRTFFADQST
jgi:hypothetical protein